MKSSEAFSFTYLTTFLSLSLSLSLSLAHFLFSSYSLLCDPQNRIGQDVSELKRHLFFRETDWDHIRWGQKVKEEEKHTRGILGISSFFVFYRACRDRPAAIPVHVKHMADTSNFDDFEELEQQKKGDLTFFSPLYLSVSVFLSLLSLSLISIPFVHYYSCLFSEKNSENESDTKDWVFQNFTFKRFEGLTQRGHLRIWSEHGQNLSRGKHFVISITIRDHCTIRVIIALWVHRPLLWALSTLIFILLLVFSSEKGSVDCLCVCMFVCLYLSVCWR